MKIDIAFGLCARKRSTPGRAPLLACAALVTVCLLAPSAFANNLIQDGSFENATSNVYGVGPIGDGSYVGGGYVNILNNSRVWHCTAGKVQLCRSRLSLTARTRSIRR